jgi:hypothetical protein
LKFPWKRAGLYISIAVPALVTLQLENPRKEQREHRLQRKLDNEYPVISSMDHIHGIA